MHVVFFIILTLFWGGSYLAIHYAIAVYPPLLGVALRVGGALIPVLLYLWWRGISIRISSRQLLHCAVSGLLTMGIAWVLLFWGEHHVAPAVVGIINAAGPIITTVSVPFFQRTAHTTRNQWMGILLGIIGIACIFSPQLRDGAHAELLGLSAILAMTIIYGLAVAFIQPITLQLPGTTIFVWQAIPAFLFLLGLSVATESWPQWTQMAMLPSASIALGYLAICSTALAFLIWFRLLRTIGSVATSTVTYCMPLVSIALDAIVLHRIPPRTSLVGMAIILSGVRLVQPPQKASDPF